MNFYKKTKIKGEASVFNLGNEKTTKLMDFLKILENTTNIKFKKKFIKKQMGDVEKTGANLNIEKKKFNLKFEHSLTEGLEKFYNWFKGIKMKKNIKFGILGLGRVIENRVYKVFKNELKNSKVVSVFDKDQKKNSKYSKLFNLKKNKSIKDFLNSNTDYIYIATESGNHAKDIMKCFEANKNVIVEKPPTLRIDQLIKLSLIAKKKLKFYAIYQNRMNNSVEYLKKRLIKNLFKIQFL